MNQDGAAHRQGAAAGGGTVGWLDQLPAAAAVLGRQGQVLQYNDGAAALFGWSGTAPVALAAPGASWFLKLLERIRTDTEATSVISRRRKDGRIAVELRCRRLDEERLLVLFRECTAQVLARKTRRSGEHHLRHFLDRLPEPVIIEQAGTIAYANPAAALLNGRSASALAGTPTDHLLPAEVLNRIRTATDPDTRGVEVALDLDGTGRVVNVIRLFLQYGGRPSLVLLVRDVTDQRIAEKGLLASRESLKRSEEQLRQSQKMDAIGRLAAGIAHDFNNLLTAMQGHVQFVLEDLPADAPVLEDVMEIRRVADRATELTRQLLTFARRQPHRPQPVEVNSVVQDVERLLRRLVRADIALDLVLEEDLPLAFTDRGQLEQVLVNLAVNARDAMPDGGVITIRTARSRFDPGDVTATSQPLQGEYVQLAISDTGCGMSPDVQSKMFEPFFTTKAEGTGLGLPTVYGIVKQSGGHISVYSEEGVGTAIKVFLPAAAEHQEVEPVPVDETRRELPAVAPGAATVLLVEDDAAIRSLAERTLRANGLNVVAACSGEEALGIASSGQPFDVVVTDLMMPNMTGDELAHRIVDIHPDARIVMMSGFSEDVLSDSRLVEHHYFIEKPFTQQQLLQTVNRALTQ